MIRTHALSRALVIALAIAPTLALAQSAPALNSATWWDPAEAGWGVFSIDQGSTLALGWFTYDGDGEPTWFLMPGSDRQADGSYRGEVHRFTGVPLAQIAGNAADPSTVVGNATLRFTGDKAMQFDWTVGGQTRSKALTRFAYGDKDLVCRAGAASRANATNYSDLWWNESSSGWGLFMQHVDNDLYATWYTYDTDREALFLAAAATRQSDGSFTGPLYRQRNGTPFTQINGAPPSADADIIGSVTLRFSDGQTGTFSYTIGNVTQSKPITRIVFGSQPNTCEVVPYQTGNGGGGGGGGTQDCYPEYTIGQTRRIRSRSTSNGTASEFSFRETITGNATFNGQSGFVEEYDGTTTAGTGVYARNYLANGNGTLVSFGAQALNPSTGQVISTSTNDPARVELARSFTVGTTVPLDFKVNGSAQGVSTVTDIKSTFKLLGKESVTVPAGTFEACKFEVTIEERTSVSGVSTHTQLAGFSWTSPVFGRIKYETDGTSRVTGFGQNITTNLTNLEEMVSAQMNGQSVP